MADSLTVGGALGALKTAFDLTKALVDVRDATKVQAVRFELMSLLLEAQEAQATLVAEKRELESRLSELEAWDREKERYKLTAVGQNGAVSYVLKEEAEGSEPTHYLCAGCFERREKAFLQPHTVPEGRAKVLVCHACTSQILISGVTETRMLKPGGAPASWGRQTTTKGRG